ncbi:outer membrane beta-barrel protein [Methylobacterium sp.]|uniref:outer membrane protein n=1 Tax=Methylobacterium sp. TaxID=409 RepID=UPI0025EA35B1|nr:outer membrane beta-barrel protein [Methylobacterium sp.]
MLVLLSAALVSGASAADLMTPLPAPELRPTIDEFGSGFYLRGDIGLSTQGVGRLTDSLNALGTIEKINLDFASAPFVGVGFGQQFNRWVRGDVTAEYRGKATFLGLDRYRDGSLPLGYGTNEYTATKRELVFLANGYTDLGTFYGITPFVGAGIGTSYNTIDNFKDTNTVTQGVAYAKSNSKLNLAWALYAGLAYDVTPNLKLEFAYRYLNLGDAKTGSIYTYDGRCALSGCDTATFKSIDSHDVKVGARWLLGAPARGAEFEPLVRKY